MREFESWSDYHTFAASVARRSRYVFEPNVEAFLQTVIETGQKRKKTLQSGVYFWRAQLGEGTNYQPYDPDDPDGEQMPVPALRIPAMPISVPG